MKEFFFSLEILESLSLSKKKQQNFEFSCSGCLSWQDQKVDNLKKILLFFTLFLYTCISNLICEFGSLRFCAYIHWIIFNYLHKSYINLSNFELFF